MSNILLSICIPTYNRSEILDNTLSELFLNPEFDHDKIEVVVSDNCSTDDTKVIVKKYPHVKYFVNDVNIKDYNFTKVLTYSNGKYIRLFNDTLVFKPGSLSFMLKVVEENLDEKNNVLFYQNMFLNQDCSREIYSLKDYFANVSFLSTWIANFGIWRNDFNQLTNKDRYSELQFPQLDWTYKIIKNGKKTIIYFSDFFTVTVPNKKGGYNIFNTFINKYLFIVRKERLAIWSYEVEKYRLFRYFAYPWLITLLIIDKDRFSFDKKGVWMILFKKYWYAPYFYVIMLLFGIRKIRG